MLVVTKFGGSSLASAEQFKKVKNIVLSDPKRKVVVVSAPGKRCSDDSKITDLLYILHAHLKYAVPYEDIWQMIRERYIEIRDDLRLDYCIEEELDIIRGQLNKNISQDYLISRGEFLNAKLMSKYLGQRKGRRTRHFCGCHDGGADRASGDSGSGEKTE